MKKVTHLGPPGKVAIFDIDGTIFRSSLLIELTEALVRERIFPAKTKAIYERAYKRWHEREGSYEEYIGAVIRAFESNIKGVKRNDFLRVAKKVVVSNQNRVYHYTRDLIKELRGKNYYLLAISSSPHEVVERFCKKLGFHKVYGRIYEVGRNGKFTGKVSYAGLISDKSKILRRAVAKEYLTLKKSVGVGDTESDIAFLEKVKTPICFNPNKKLYTYAKRHGWQIVVERKDVIYDL